MSAQTPIKASTQEHLDINDIVDDLAILKGGACCLVLQTTAINFGLLSEREQEATIFAYAGCLNSLTFPVQILIQSRQKDISAYLNFIDQNLKNIKNDLLLVQAKKYRQFVESTVKKNRVLDKKFYLVLSYASIEFKKSALRTLIERAKTDLYPKRDHLISQLQRLGLRCRQLTSQELIALFYQTYNVEAEGQQFASPQDFNQSLVQTNLNPQPIPINASVSPAAPVSISQPVNPKPLPRNYSYAPKPNPLMPKISEPVLPVEGGKLQEEINSLIKKVSVQPSQTQKTNGK